VENEGLIKPTFYEPFIFLSNLNYILLFFNKYLLLSHYPSLQNE